MSVVINPNDHLKAFAYLNSIEQSVVDTYLLEREMSITYTENWRRLVTNDDSNIYRVTNINSSGPGSFLDGLTYNGDETRHIIFDVAGTIVLPEKWSYNSRNIVVHGDTSPGGICITGAPMAFVDCENLEFHHIMWCLDEAPNQRLAKVWNPIKITSHNKTCRNILFNHCSVFGGDDENNFGPSNHYERNVDLANDGVTVQNCIFGFGTRQWRGNHNFSLAVSFGRDMVIKNNLFLHNNRRSPQVYCPPGQCEEGGVIAGNVVYNYGSMAVGVIRGTFDVYDNTFIHGRNSKPNANFKPIKTTGTFQSPGDYSVLYIDNNKMYSRKRKFLGSDSEIFGHENSIPVSFRQRRNWHDESTLTSQTVINTAGTKFNHSLEQRCRNNVNSDGSTWIDTMSDIGGVPEIPFKDEIYMGDIEGVI